MADHGGALLQSRHVGDTEIGEQLQVQDQPETHSEFWAGQVTWQGHIRKEVSEILLLTY